MGVPDITGVYPLLMLRFYVCHGALHSLDKAGQFLDRAVDVGALFLQRIHLFLTFFARMIQARRARSRLLYTRDRPLRFGAISPSSS